MKRTTALALSSIVLFVVILTVSVIGLSARRDDVTGQTVVQQYYSHLQSGQFDQALRLVSGDWAQCRLQGDLSYETQFMIRSLRELSESNQYQLVDVSETVPVKSGSLLEQKQMSFATNFHTQVNGKTFYHVEYATVQKVREDMRIVSLTTSDHFVRYRSYCYELVNVNNGP